MNILLCSVGKLYRDESTKISNFGSRRKNALLLGDRSNHEIVSNQVIPGNPQKYVSTNCSLLQCKTSLPISVIIWFIVYETLFKSKMNGGCAFRRA